MVGVVNGLELDLRVPLVPVQDRRGGYSGGTSFIRPRAPMSHRVGWRSRFKARASASPSSTSRSRP